MVKVILNTDIEYDPARHSSSSFHIRADVLNLLFLHDLFIYYIIIVTHIVYIYLCIVNAKV